MTTSSGNPVAHLSYSALYSYFSSPAKFWKQYVMKAPFERRVTMIFGSAWHHGIEMKLKGHKDPVGSAIRYVFKELEKTPESEKEDQAKIDRKLNHLEKNLDFFLPTTKEWDVIDIEKGISCPSPVEGGLPMKGKIDLVVPDEIWDHKYVYAASGKPDEFYYVQAWFYYQLYKHEYGKTPKAFRILEFKETPYRSGKPQYVPRVIVYDPKWIEKVSEWYLDVCIQINAQRRFPANPFDIFGGADWKEYLNQKIC